MSTSWSVLSPWASGGASNRLQIVDVSASQTLTRYNTYVNVYNPVGVPIVLNLIPVAPHGSWVNIKRMNTESTLAITATGAVNPIQTTSGGNYNGTPFSDNNRYVFVFLATPTPRWVLY